MGATQTEPEVLGEAPRLGDFEYLFPAIRGVQAGREFYVSMCPLRLIPKIFLFDEDELVPELRAQRVLNRQRVPDLARYITANPESYVFSALTASIDGKVAFEGLGAGDHGRRIGTLRIPMDSRFVINDGQHRRAAIELALEERPELANESIAVVFFLDAGLGRCQQMFADLNRYAIRPSRSLGVLYDQRDDMAALARLIVLESPVFRGLVEMEKSTLSHRSRRLFTLSAIYGATVVLLEDQTGDPIELSELARSFWEAAEPQFPEWAAVRDNRLTAGEVRTDFIHTRGLVLHALGIAGAKVIDAGHTSKDDLLEQLKPIAEIDWSRENTELWEGRAMVGGTIAKSRQNVLLTANVILQALGLPLPPEHQQAEDALGEKAR